MASRTPSSSSSSSSSPPAAAAAAPFPFTVRTLVGVTVGATSRDGPAHSAIVNTPVAILYQPHDRSFLVGEYDGLIRRVAHDGSTTTVGRKEQPVRAIVYGASASSTDVYVAWGYVVEAFRPDSGATFGAVTFPQEIHGLWMHPDNYLLCPSNTALYTLSLTGRITLLLGHGSEAGNRSGRGNVARFNGLRGIVMDRQGNIIVADNGNHRICMYSFATDTVTTLVGSTLGSVDGPLASARLNTPSRLMIDRQDALYVSQFDGHCISRIAGGRVLTIAGRAATAGSVDGPSETSRFTFPRGLALDATQTTLWTCDDHRIRSIALPPLLGPVLLSATVACAMNASHIATHRCHECAEHLCAACAVLRHTGTSLSGHRVTLVLASASPSIAGSTIVCALDENHSGIMSICDTCCRALCAACDAAVHRGVTAEHKRTVKVRCENECENVAVIECAECKNPKYLCAECDGFIHRAGRKSHPRSRIGGAPGPVDLGSEHKLDSRAVDENYKLF